MGSNNCNCLCVPFSIFNCSVCVDRGARTHTHMKRVGVGRRRQGWWVGGSRGIPSHARRAAHVQ